METFPTFTIPIISENEVIVPITEYETHLEDDIQNKFVKWVYKLRVKGKESQSSESLSEGGLNVGRPSTIIWTKVYTCHRSGKKRIRTNLSIGGNSGKVRPIQKKSKKIGCTAQVNITCFKDTPNFVTIKYVGRHMNHEIGNIMDLQYLPLSNKLKNKIEIELERGIDHRTIRTFLQKEIEGEITANRDFHLHFMDIYNIYIKTIYDKFKFDEDDFNSTKIWLEKLKNNQYFTQNLEFSEESFSFSFSSPYQIQLLQNSANFCMDATHGVTINEKIILYSLVIRHPITGKGTPVSYMLTNNHSRFPITRWLTGLKDIGMSPLRITIDCSIPEMNGITHVFGSSTEIQLCLFHVSRAWNTNIKLKIKGDSTGTNKILWSTIMGELKLIMYEKNIVEFESKLEIFLEKWKEYSDFIRYFKREWTQEEKKKMWSAAYQPEIFTNMATNNYIESWHNQLKSVYLKRRRNRRLDRLLYILTEDVAIDLKNDVARLSLYIGKMSPFERQRRKREIEAESILEDQLQEMIESRGEDCFLVQSFFEEDLVYEVYISENIIYKCNCTDFTINQNPCKHMYLLLRRFQNFTVPSTISSSNERVDINISSNIEIFEEITQNIITDELATRFEEFAEILRSGDFSQHTLRKIDKLCTAAYKEIEITNIFFNSRLERQRR